MTRLFIAGFLLLVGCSPNSFVRKELASTEKLLQDHIGFYLADARSSKVLLEYNSEKYFTPASNTKIFTLYTSLRLLGDSITALKFAQSGDSLFIQGTGDPSFLYPAVYDNGRVYQFLQNNSARLFFLTGNFQTEALGPGWAWDDYNDYYSAERSPFPLYGNIIDIRHPSDSVFHFFPPRFSGDFVKSNEAGNTEKIIRGVDSNQLTYFNGRRKLKSFIIPFRTSEDLTADLLSDTLHRDVEQINRPMPGSARVLKSIPADSVYKVMMIESDNFIAEQLLLQCAWMLSDTLKPEIAIRHSMKNFLADLPDKPQWVDGSGLSRFNLFTPRSVAALWKKIYAVVPQERLFKIIAVGGKSGTLKTWLKADRPYVYGKTGSLTNVRALSGFIITKKNKVLVFSLMNNNFTAPGADVRKHTERLLQLVRDNY